MKAVLSGFVTLTGFTKHEEEIIRKEFALANAAYFKAKNSGRSCWGISKVIYYARKYSNFIIVPYGALSLLVRKFPNIKLVDKTSYPKVDIALVNKYKPRGFQVEAAKATPKKRSGILQVPTGGGKTILGLRLIHSYKTPTLVICDSKEIYKQWLGVIEHFLGFKAGQIQGKKFDIQPVTIAMSQTLAGRKEQSLPYKDYFGMILVDECQQIGPATKSSSFEHQEDPMYNRMGRVTQWFNARRRYGMTDSPMRSDGQTKAVEFAMGETIYKVDFNLLVDEQCIIKPKLIVKETEYSTPPHVFDVSKQYMKLMEDFFNDVPRKKLIADDIVSSKNESCLILSIRKQYLEDLLALAIKRDPSVEATSVIITGDTKKKIREQAMDDMRSGKLKHLYATSLADKGLDIPILKKLFSVSPSKFEGKQKQRMGRVVRFDPNKKDCQVIEYVDIKVPVLRNQFINKFKTVYKERTKIDYDNETLIKLKLRKK